MNNNQNNNNKISSIPPKINAAEFIAGAGKKVTHHEVSKEVYPWNLPHVRDDVIKSTTVTLKEEYTIKLKYISEKTGKSQQKIMKTIIYNGLDKILKEHGAINNDDE